MPTTPSNKLQRWMRKASAAEKQQLATLADTTVPTLRQIAGAYRTRGALSVSPEMAARLERASVVVHDANPNLPIVLRIHLSPVCAHCEIAKAHFATR